MSKDCTCIECNRTYVYDRQKGHTYNKCNSCLVNQRRFLVKTKAVRYKGGKCSKCGYKKCISALEFHHLTKDKDFNISGAHARSWKKIKEELDKCILVCANCHREIHEEMSGRIPAVL